MSIIAGKPGSQWRSRYFRAAGLVSSCSILTLFARHWWVADLIANLRVQLIIGMLAAALVLLTLRRWNILLIVMALTLWQANSLRSAFEPDGISADRSQRDADSVTLALDEPRLRVFLANVFTGNQQHDQIINQIRSADPDVFAILELSSVLEASLCREFLTTHKHVVSESQDEGNFGIGLWSRYPLSDGRVFHLNAPILPSIEAHVQMPSCLIHVVATHPLPPIGARNFGHRNRHLSLLAERIRKTQRDNPSRSMILVGDLNLTPWSPLLEDFLASTGLRNSAAGQGLRPTWYRWSAFPFGLVLDHGLHSGNLHCDRRAILEGNGSDHRALVFDFSVNDTR